MRSVAAESIPDLLESAEEARRRLPHELLFRRELTSVSAEQATWLVPRAGASQLRDSTGITPASLRYTGRGYVPGAERIRQRAGRSQLEWPPMRIAIAVFEGAEELDFVGRWEVLTAWRFLYPDDVDVILVAEDTAVSCAKGMRVVAHTSWDELGDVDILVYPGGRSWYARSARR